MPKVFKTALAALTITVVCALVCNAAPKPQRSTPGAFLPYKSNSVEELVRQVGANPRAAQRYARHYGMSVQGVIKYFSENLTLTTLKKPYKAQIYYISNSNKVLYRHAVLPMGTLVYATSDGVPILDWRCSNPIGRILPVKKVVVPKPKPTIPTPPVAVEVKPQPPIEIVQPAMTAVVSTVEAIPAPIIAATTPEVPAVPSLSIPTAAIAAVVPALFGAFAMRAENDNPPVPEPCSMVGLSVCLGGMALRLRKNRK